MNAPLRTLLVGYGLAGEAFHAPFIATTPGMELTTVVTANAERAARARLRYPGVTVQPSVDAALDSADHDVVVVATPNDSHVPLGLAAVARGLHVVVDKPLAPSAAAGRELAGAARAAGVVLSPFQNRRWDGDFLTVRRLLAEGALGTPQRFESRFERWRPEPDLARWREQADPALAGGLLFDLGSHLVDQAMQLFGPPVSVYAEVDRRRPGVVVDDDVFVALAHRGGVRSHLWASMTAADEGPRFRVLGTEAAYVTFGLDPQEDELRAGRSPRDAGFGAKPPAAWGRLGAGGDDRAVPTDDGDYAQFYAGFAAAVHDGAAPPVTADDGVLVLEVLEAARRSAEEGVVVRFTPGA